MTTSVQSLSGGALPLQSSQDKSKLTHVAKQFEAVFVRQLMGAMRQAGFGDDLTGSSSVEQFQEMADAKTADALAERGGLGIAELLLGQLGGKDKAVTDSATTAATGTKTA